MIPVPDVYSAAIALTTLLAFGVDPIEMFGRAVSPPTWLPLAVLAAFAAACGVLGVSDPETFAAAFGVI